MASLDQGEAALFHLDVGSGEAGHLHREDRFVADDQGVAAAGGKLEAVVVAVADRLRDLDLDSQRPAGKGGGVKGADPGRGQAGIHGHAQLRHRRAGGQGLGLALFGEAAGGISRTLVGFGVTVTKQVDHGSRLPANCN